MCVVGLIVDWLMILLIGVVDVGKFFIGDFNSYVKEDFVVFFVDKGYVDMVVKFIGKDVYSYVYGGEFGYIDYVFVILGFVEYVCVVYEWYINVDELVVLEYVFVYKSVE